MSTSPAHTGAPLGGDQVVDPKDKNPRKSRSRFDLSYKYATTLRFGECRPFLMLHCLPKSSKTVHSSHSLRSLSLASPLMQNVRLKKDYFAIPKRALLPRTWDLIYTNPLRGEDIDAGQANTLMPNYLYFFTQLKYQVFLSDSFINISENASYQAPRRWLNFALERLALLNSLFAKDSLFRALRIPLYLKDLRGSFDGTTLVDTFGIVKNEWQFFHGVLDTIATADGTIRVTFGTNNRISYQAQYAVDIVSSDGVHSRNYSERMRLYTDFLEYPHITNLVLPVSTDYVAMDADFADVVDLQVASQNFALFAYDDYLSMAFQTKYCDPNNPKHRLNWSSMLSYQLACVEFYTNDSVDNIYSTDLFRAMYEGDSALAGTLNFTLNGLNCRYDAFSFVGMDTLVNNMYYSFDQDDAHILRFAKLLNLITPKRSLRFVDYFVGSRTRPLAAVSTGTKGDVEFEINDNKASAVDVTRSIQAQRFLTQVNRVGRRVKDYLKGIFDTLPMERADLPVLLASSTETIYGVEVQNTGSDQLSESQTITTNFESNENRFAFEFSSREETTIIGICYFDIARFYDRGIERQALEVDRFDMFNPYFQFIGDQPLLLSEYDSTEATVIGDDTQVFGYTGRDMQRKVLTDYCDGDFVGDPSIPDGDRTGLLKSWIFKNDYAVNVPALSPDFIRSHQTELDRYYLSMTGSTLADRYHFICLFTNRVDSSDPMAFNPQILG